MISETKIFFSISPRRHHYPLLAGVRDLRCISRCILYPFTTSPTANTEQRLQVQLATQITRCNKHH